MFQKIAKTMGCAAVLFVTGSYAATTHVMRMGSGFDFELPANQPQVMSNPFVWNVSAACTILADTDDFIISFKVMRKKGTLNGKKMSAGDTALLTVHAKDTIKITAVPGAEMELTNLGDKTAHAECTVS